MWGKNGECKVSKNTKRVAAQTKQQSTCLCDDEKKRTRGKNN